MSIRRRVWLTFGSIIVLAILAGIVVYPKGPNISIGSWQRELKVRLGLDLQGGTQLIYEAGLNEIPASEQADAVEGVRDVIERRVNAFGVSEPVIQTNKRGDQWRVIVELAGVYDVNEAIRSIGETPTLEFREQAPTASTQPERTDEEVKSRANDLVRRISSGEDFSSLANEFSEDPGNVKEDGSKAGGDLGFVSRGTFVKEFDETIFDRLKVGEVTTEPVKTIFGYHVIRKTDERVTPADEGSTKTEVRASHILLRTAGSPGNESENFVSTGLSGKQLQRAQVQFDPNTNEPQVGITFNDEGKKLFGDLTTKNVGKPLAIFLDGAIISAPTVQQAITDGQAVISGSFTLDEAKTLARRLNAGALPVPISLVSQQTIGPTLGRSSIERSLFAGVIGLVAVAIFMIVYYRLPGLLSVVALVLYSTLVLTIFKLFGVTLTLAGMTGFILSIGMAVDANILIYERSKEEIRSGRDLANAIEVGFQRAWLSIRDSNVSSIITSIILIWFGTSIVKGFAVTLLIGILVSMFSAITVTRTFLRLVSISKLRHRWRLFGFGKPQ